MICTQILGYVFYVRSSGKKAHNEEANNTKSGEVSPCVPMSRHKGSLIICCPLLLY